MFVVWTVSSPCPPLTNLGVWRTVSAFRYPELTIIMKQTKQCTDCRMEKPLSDFYKSSSHSLGVMCYCKPCFNKRVIRRWINRKIKAIKYKGSRCQRSKLHLKNSHYAVFEFHHTNPSAKETHGQSLD